MLDLGNQPLANRLLTTTYEPYERYRLCVRICDHCKLGQLDEFVPPEKMFTDYVYYTSVCGPSVESARAQVDEITSNTKLPTDALVVEIGSNDGYLLQFYKERGIGVLGIDPAHGPAKAAQAKGIATVKDYFTADLARRLPKADIIHANNVLAHVPDLNDFVAGLAILLKPGGNCYIEVPYLERLLKGCEFDTVYHEHHYYFSFQSLKLLFQRHGLDISYAAHLDAHGGSLRLRVGLHSNFTMHEKIDQYCEGLQSRADKIAFNLKKSMIDMALGGKTLWGFGAAAKATVMLNYCGIQNNLIRFIADETPAKIGKYIPGTRIRVIHPDEWLSDAPDYTCIFAWNHAQAIEERYTDSYHGSYFTPYKEQV